MIAQDAKKRLDALERLTNPSNIPISICRMADGDIRTYEGLSVLEPFIDGKISLVICDAAATAQLLRAMDKEKAIEVAWMDGNSVHREQI